MHPHKPHATSQPSRFSHLPREQEGLRGTHGEICGTLFVCGALARSLRLMIRDFPYACMARHCRHPLHVGSSDHSHPGT